MTDTTAPEVPESGASSQSPTLLVLVVLMMCLLVGVVTYGVMSGRLSMGSGGSTQTFVMFDVSKYMNAQRAVAGSLLQGSGDTDAIATISQAGRLVKQTIRQIVGPNAVVLVKQAVVDQGGMVDVTDQVLVALGLPTDVDSIDAAYQQKMLSDPAPTAHSARYGDVYKQLLAESRARDDLQVTNDQLPSEVEKRLP